MAQKLRRAIYYTNIDLQPKEAFKYYKQALGVAAQLQLDPYCEEVVGIKIELARMFEKADLTKNAVEVLEIVRRELGEWMVTGGGRKDGGLGGMISETAEEKDQGLIGSVTDSSRRLVGEETAQGVEATGVDWAKRTVILRTLIRTHVKLGDLYSDTSLNEQALAEERLVWAVTALLKERKRREDEGEKEGEGELFPNDEVGAALECKLLTYSTSSSGIPLSLKGNSLLRSDTVLTRDPPTALADHYSSQSKHYLSMPLYLQSLAFNPSTCHTVILMNNLATTLAQQGGPADETPPSLATAADASGMPPPSTTTQLSNAEQWATKALKLGQSIQPPARTQECDVGCAVATITLGDLARLEGRTEKARRYWEEGKGLAKVVGYAEGVQRAEEGLKAL